MISPNLNRNLVLLLCLYFGLINSNYAAESRNHTTTQNECNAFTPGQISNRFTDLADGTVFDTLTDLIWERCNLSQVWSSTTESCQSFTKTRNWRDSLVAIQNYNANQYALGLPDNWRMPNIKELTSIVNPSCISHALDQETFLSIEAAYWSSTPVAEKVYEKTVFNPDGTISGYQDENFIWIVNTITGRDTHRELSNEAATLLVRNPTNP